MLPDYNGGGYTPAQAYALDKGTEASYDAFVKVPNLGNYEFKVETHEIPSHEVLPIIDKSYFPSSVTTYMSEVDNTAPSALYEAKTVAKVDIVFAFGDYGQLSLMEDTIPSFTASLQEASNHIDAKVTSVETTTGGFDINATTPEEIIATWTQHPNPNRFIANGSILKSNGSWQAFTYDAPNSGTTTRMSGHCKPHSRKLNHACGFICKWNKETDTAIFVSVGNNYTCLYWVQGVSYMFGEGRESTTRTWVNCLTTTDRLHTVGESLSNQYSRATCLGSIGNDSADKFSYTTFTLTGTTFVVTTPGGWFTGKIPYNQIGIDGVYCSCTGWVDNFSIECENIVKKSLGESISDVDWRDNSTRFIIHCTDSIPVEMEEGRESDYQYTITKLLNSNAYLINLGTNFNKAKLNELLSSLTTANNIKQGTYFDNVNVNSALTNSKNYIIDIVKNLAKPENWILVNEQVYWNTLYNDQEHDLPLNLGEHDGTKNQDDSDVKLTNSWGVALTHLYTADKILAEKWRYRHFNNYFDNSTVRESFHTVWLDNPVEIFPNPGLYRINYKRKDNPFHPNVDLAHEFDNYRYWSTDYDKRE